MGLDLTVMAKPLPGHEAEFRDLLIALSIDAGVMTDPRAAERSRLWRFARALLGSGNLSAAKRQSLLDRHDAISLPAYANLGAPRVGDSAAADQWFRDGYAAASPMATPRDIEDALQGARGHYVLPLVPGPCDGLPAYSNGQFGHVDETSFRGTFVDDCTDVLTQDDRRAVWQVMFPAQLTDYGHHLRHKALDFATRQGVAHVIGAHAATWTDQGAPEAQAHIADSLGRWAIFWGERGHGSYPDF